MCDTMHTKHVQVKLLLYLCNHANLNALKHQIHSEDMLLERPLKVAMASTIIILMLFKVAPTSTFLNVNKIRKHCHFFIT